MTGALASCRHSSLDHGSRQDAGEVDPPELEGAGLDRVLYLHMAALAWVRGKRIEDARDALARTLEHERHYWYRAVAGLGLDGSLADHLQEAVGPALAALTLVGGTTSEDETRSLVERVTEVSAPRRDLGKTLLRFLYRIYGGSKGVYLGLEPDLLGEELVASCLADEPALLDRVLEVAGAGGRASALTVLTRLAGRRPEEERWLERAFEGHVEELAEPALAVAVEVGDPVGRVLAGFVGGASAELAERLMNRCDADDFKKSVRPNAFLPELARSLINLGNDRSALGRRKEALEATREAVEREPSKPPARRRARSPAVVIAARRFPT